MRQGRRIGGPLTMMTDLADQRRHHGGLLFQTPGVCRQKRTSAGFFTWQDWGPRVHLWMLLVQFQGAERGSCLEAVVWAVYAVVMPSSKHARRGSLCHA